MWEQKEEKALGLYEYLSIIRKVTQELFSESMWIEAEISSASIPKGAGHCYLELSESDANGDLIANVNAHIWRSTYAVLYRKFVDVAGRIFERGDKVCLKVLPDFSQRYGFSLNIVDINPAVTLGELAAKKAATWKRLVKEGLTELNKELEVPALPFVVAVVSAEGAAGYGDFMKHISQGEKDLECRFKIDLYEAPMQGITAPEGIRDAFEEINASEVKYDAVVFIRGGGSDLDLACFDEYLVCKAIAGCNYPVISGIGHERDNHLCDDVASVRVKTPTAAADFLIDRIAEEKSKVEEIKSALFSAADDKLSSAQLQLERIITRISNSYNNKLSEEHLLIEGLYRALTNAYIDKISRGTLSLERIKSSLLRNYVAKLSGAERDVAVLEQRIIAANPANVLEKGYGYLDVDGHKLTDIHALKDGSRVRLKMKDGVAEFTIKELSIKEL